MTERRAYDVTRGCAPYRVASTCTSVRKFAFIAR